MRGLEEVFEGDSIWNMFARRDFDGSYFARQQSVSVDVVGVRGLLDPEGLIDGELARHAHRDRQTPALVSVKHERAGITNTFPQHGRSS